MPSAGPGVVPARARPGAAVVVCLAPMFRFGPFLRHVAIAILLGGAVAAAFAQAQVPPAPQVVPDTLAERVQPCMSCHGREGRATNLGFFPRIAGKPEGYLYNQLRNFRDGRRENVLMSGLVRHLSDDYLREIAAYFAQQDLPYPPPQGGAHSVVDLQRAADLVARGDKARKVPACVQCHGAAMTGVQPAIPGLLGLPHDYLVAQFGAWRNGLRHAAAPDCMKVVAESLSAEEVSAVAAWLAAQPLPVDPHPAAAIAQPLPLDCGSGLR